VIFAPLAHAALAAHLGEGEVLCARLAADSRGPGTLAGRRRGAGHVAGQGRARARETAPTASSACCSSRCRTSRTCFRVADIACAMTVEALLGTDRPFADDLQALRPPTPGQRLSATNLRALLHGSAIVASHAVGDLRVQDAYSLRCAPQVHGAARDTPRNLCQRG